MKNPQDAFRKFEVPDPIRIEKVARLVRAHFQSLSGIRVLECGIAKGGLADILNREGAKCFGVDINPRVLAGVTIARADLNEGIPDFKTEFDVIFAGEVMEHLFDDEKFIASTRELLRPGGILMLTVPNLAFSMNRLRVLLGMMPLFAYAPYHYHFYTKCVLVELLERHGFKTTGFTSSHVLFSSRRNRVGAIFEVLGDVFPSWGAHLIVRAEKA
jgi:2-polyprenyl-3-methyl-5-hydroxy-6-metoxy-1,4-benzoquinol methylase